MAARRHQRPRSGRRGAAAPAEGETLLEVLIAIMIIGIAGAAVMSAFGTSVTLSGVHRRLTTTDSDARNFADRLTRAVDTGVDPVLHPSAPAGFHYIACAAPAVYSSPPGFTASSGDTVSIAGVTYWNGSSFANTCTNATDTGVQRVAVTIANADARATTSIQVVIRKPCLLWDVTVGPCP